MDGDSTASPLGRVLNLLCEQIEFAPATEHNFSFSYAPYLKQLGTESLIATCPGIGLTAGRRHTTTHQNVFPVKHVPGKQDGGALQRPEHIQQLNWLADWDNGAEKLILIAVPRDDPIGVTRHMDVMDLQSLEPIIEGKPIDGLDSRILNWLEKLNEGYRLPAVANRGAFDNFHGSGGLRNYVKSPTDDPARIQPLDVVHAMERGQIVMTTGPFLEVAIGDSIPGDTVRAPDGNVTLQVRVQCSNVCAVDRVQVLVNGKPVTHSGRFTGGAFPLRLTSDSHVVVVASGIGPNLRERKSATDNKQTHVAVSNPIYVDVGADGFVPHSPLDDRAEAGLEFVKPLLAKPNAEPGLVRFNVRNNSDHSADDVASLEIYPPGVARIIGPNEQAYTLAPHSETALTWKLVFTEDYLAKQFPVVSTYNNASTFGVRVARSGEGPGRKPASRWMDVDHPIRSLPPIESAGKGASLLAGEPAYPVRARNAPALAEMRFAVAGNDLAVLANVADKNTSRHPVIWEGSCVEVFGSMPGRDAANADVPGRFFPVSQFYLVPQVADSPATAFRQAKGQIIPEPRVRLTSSPTPNGYELGALIPLKLLGVDVDRITRFLYLGQVPTPVSLLGEQPVAGRFLLEAHATTGDGQRATVFQSAAPHVDHHSFGTMRFEGKVSCRAETVRPLSAEPCSPSGRIRLSVKNDSKERATDTVTLQLDPPGVAQVVGRSELSYTLDAGATTNAEFDLELSKGSSASVVDLIVPRSPRGDIITTVPLTIAISDRLLPRFESLKSLEVISGALSSQLAYTVTNTNEPIAELRLAVAGSNLVLDAKVVDHKVAQHPTAWKASCIEVFGTTPGQKAISQLFLVPQVGGASAKAFRSHLGKQEPAPDILVQTSPASDGYAMHALIPLTLLAADVSSGKLMLEFQVTAASLNGEYQRGTVFGSARAYQDASRYGGFRVRE